VRVHLAYVGYAQFYMICPDQLALLDNIPQHNKKSERFYAYTNMSVGQRSKITAVCQSPFRTTDFKKATVMSG